MRENMVNTAIITHASAFRRPTSEKCWIFLLNGVFLIVGCTDSKHILTKSVKKSGTIIYNYKEFYIVLKAWLLVCICWLKIWKTETWANVHGIYYL